MKHYGIIIVPVLLSLAFSTSVSDERVRATVVSGPTVISMPIISSRVVDDYPWKYASGGTDTWGYTTRQCVSFAAFRLSQNGHTVGMWGSALVWDNYAKSVSSTPRVGSIAHWNSNESSNYYSPAGGIGRVVAGSYGHVAYVAKVYNDGSVLVEQYNLDKPRAYSTMRVTAPRYLYF